MNKTPEKWIEDLVGTFTDPIIVYPGGWEDTVPKRLREAVIMERLIEKMKSTKGEIPTATDAECCIYLYTVCMAQSLSHEWAQIYLYLGTKEMEKNDAAAMPADVRVGALSKYEEGLLNDLRRWIYERRLKGREEKRRREKAEKKRQPNQRERGEIAAAPQMRLF